MSKLLRAGIRRYFHNIVFWATLIVTSIVAIFASATARSYYFDDIYCMIVFISLAVLVSCLVGNENEEGIFRNKVVSGYTKGQVYVSELILGVSACLIMFITFTLIFVAFNSYVFTKAPLGVCFDIFLDSLLVHICIAIILVTISCLVPKRVIIAIINIVFVLAMVCGSYVCQSVVNQEKYYLEYEYEETVVTDEFGTHLTSVPIDGSGYQVENPHYMDGPVRVVAETFYDILPYGHITEYIGLTTDWFGYEQYGNSHHNNLSWETSAKVTVPQYATKEIRTNLIYSVIVIVAVYCMGFISFRKRDLR
jgi:ABC-type transport system involved in multi-copper enzyme maturation permease subunit